MTPYLITAGGVNAGVSGGARTSIGVSIAIIGGGGGGDVMGGKLKKQGDTELVTDDSETDGVAYQNLVSDGLLGTYATKTHISGGGRSEEHTSELQSR